MATKRKKKIVRSRKISNMKEYEIFYGKEPTWGDEKFEDDSAWRNEIRRAFQWYNLAPIKNSEKKKWLISFLKDNQYEEFPEEYINQIKNVPEMYLPVAGATARLLSRGAELSEIDYQSFLNIINKVKDNAIAEVIKSEKPTKETPDIQKFIKAQVADHISEIENHVSDFVDAGCVSEFSMYKYLQENTVKGLITDKIKLYFLDEYNAMVDVVNQEDEYLEEAYSHLTIKQQSRYLKFIGEIVDDCAVHINNCKSNRAPRKVRVAKVKSSDKLVAKLNYKVEDKKAKLVSINPEKLIGAQEIWTYNVKYKVLTVFRAQSDIHGMTVKGSTIRDFDEGKSERRSLRNPDLFFKNIVFGGKSKIKKEFNNLKTKLQKVNGRINKEIILLGVY